ncbi:hypothetical protein PCE1_002374 [Barthelona sp. PCE]
MSNILGMGCTDSRAVLGAMHSLQDKVRNLESENRFLSESYKKALEDLEKLRERSESDIAALKKNNEDNKTLLEQEIQSMRLERSHLLERITDLESINKGLYDKLEESQVSRLQVANEIAEVEKCAVTEKTTLTNQNAFLSKHVNMLESELDETKHEIMQLVKISDDAKKDRRNIEETLQHVLQANEDLVQRLSTKPKKKKKKKKVVKKKKKRSRSSLALPFQTGTSTAKSFSVPVNVQRALGHVKTDVVEHKKKKRTSNVIIPTIPKYSLSSEDENIPTTPKASYRAKHEVSAGHSQKLDADLKIALQREYDELMKTYLVYSNMLKENPDQVLASKLEELTKQLESKKKQIMMLYVYNDEVNRTIESLSPVITAQEKRRNSILNLARNFSEMAHVE